MKKRKFGQKMSWFFAVFCYLMSVVAIVFSFVWNGEHGTESPIFASALASIFFFGCSGFVLHTIANADLPDMSMKS